MVLDEVSLYVSVLVCEICGVIVLAFLWPIHGREPAVRYWICAFLSYFAGTSLLIAPLENVTAGILVLRDLLLLAANILSYLGIVAFFRRNPHIHWLILSLLVTILVIAYASYIRDSAQIRTIAYSSYVLLIYILAIYQLIKSSLESPQLAFTFRFVAAIHALSAGMLMSRGLLAAVIQPEYISATNQLWAGSLSLLLTPAALFLGNFAFLLMLSQRLKFELIKRGHTDTLTELLNRAGFFEASDAITRDSYVAVLDFDHFKKVNDAFGHAAGDRVLASFTRCIAGVLRPNDIVARAGGEEFWILMDDTDSEQAVGIMERIRKRVAGSSNLYEGQRTPVTVSIGLCKYQPSQKQNLKEAIHRADEAMFQAKRAGRNCWRISTGVHGGTGKGIESPNPLSGTG